MVLLEWFRRGSWRLWNLATLRLAYRPQPVTVRVQIQEPRFVPIRWRE